jgi:hypothetical protein
MSGTPPSGEVVFSWPGRYGMRLAMVDGQHLFTSARDGAFFISKKADEIQVYPAARDFDASKADGMVPFLIRRVLPRIAQLHGRTGLHGASVMINQQDALLLLGTSGAGKSTLSVALHRELGWTVLSDDISLIDGSAAPTRCFPVVLGACLWPDSLASLAYPDMKSHKLPAHDEKRWRELSSNSHDESAVVRALIFLDQNKSNHTEVNLVRLAPAQAIIAAMQQLVRLNPLDAEALERDMDILGCLLQHTPAYTLTYPRQYTSLPSVAEYLHSHFVGALSC